MTDIAVKNPHGFDHVNKPLFLITGGFITLFCITALINLDRLSGMVDAGFAWSATYFGLYWQLLLLATFLIGLVLCVLPGGGAKMGAMALILVSTGSGGIGKLQSFIVVTAVPVSLILLPSLWDAVRITLAKGNGTA